jgi:hypothetical protein
VRILVETWDWGIGEGSWTGGPELSPLPRDEQALAWRLRELTFDAHAMRVLRAFLAHENAARGALSDQEVISRILVLVERCRLTPFRRKPSLLHWRGGSAVEPEAPPPPAEDLGSSKVRSWIEIELLDESDRPVPGVRFRAVLADGSVREGTLNAQGLARLDDVEPGTCDLSFPDLDGREWEAA